MKVIDLTGQRFGKLKVVRRSEKNLYSQAAFVCKCDCGNTKVVCGASLRRGATRSCGCQTVHTGNKFAVRHGLYKHRLSGIWRSMKERCQNPKHIHYKSYGGRGIYVCQEWQSLENFVRDNEPIFKEGLSLDRVDNDGPYSPENCRWTNKTQQGRNRRNNLLLTFKSRTQPCSAWAAELGIPETTLRQRIRAGWSHKKALTTPVRQYSK